MGIAGGYGAWKPGVASSVSFSIRARRRAVWPDGDLGSSNRPFPRRRPRSNGSAREPSGPHVAGGGEAAFEPHRLHPSEGRSGGLEPQLPRGVDGSKRGGPRLPSAGDRTTPREPSRLNRRRVRSLPLPNPILSFGAAAASAWFEKQPEWRHPGGTSVDVCAHEGVVVTKALVYERPRPPQFP